MYSFTALYAAIFLAFSRGFPPIFGKLPGTLCSDLTIRTNERIMCAHKTYLRIISESSSLSRRTVRAVCSLSVKNIQGVRKFNRQTFRDCREHYKNHFLQINLWSETCHYIATCYERLVI